MKESYTVAERLDLIANACCGSRMAELARRSGIDKPTISRMRSGTVRLTPYYADKIASVSPVINRSWLESGTGYPGDLSIELVRERLEEEISRKDDTIKELLMQLETQRKVIDKLIGQ